MPKELNSNSAWPDEGHIAWDAVRPCSVAFAAAIVLLAQGCFQVTRTTTAHDKPIRTYTENRVNRAVPRYRIELEQVVNPSGGIRVRAVRGDSCETHEVAVVDRTEHVSRDVAQDKKLTGWAYAGIAGAGVAGVGIYKLASGTPFVDDGNLTSAGWMTAIGGTTVAALVLADTIRLHDTSRHVGTVNLPAAVTVASCNEAPLAGGVVALGLQQRGTPIEVTTDMKGEAIVEGEDFERLARDWSAEGGKSVSAFNVNVMGQVLEAVPAPVWLIEDWADRDIARHEQAAQVERAAQDAIGQTEVENGKCHPDRAARLQAAMGRLQQMYSGMSRGSAVYAVGAHIIAVASEKGHEFGFTSGLVTSTMHILAIGFSPVELTVLDANGYEVRTTSELGAFTATTMSATNVDSRALVMNGRGRAAGTVRGKGCVLVVQVATR